MGSLSYNGGDVMVNLIDMTRGLGLVHGVIAVSLILCAIKKN